MTNNYPDPLHCQRCGSMLIYDGAERFCVACGARPDVYVRLAGAEDQPRLCDHRARFKRTGVSG